MIDGASLNGRRPRRSSGFARDGSPSQDGRPAALSDGRRRGPMIGLRSTVAGRKKRVGLRSMTVGFAQRGSGRRSTRARAARRCSGSAQWRWASLADGRAPLNERRVIRRCGASLNEGGLHSMTVALHSTLEPPEAVPLDDGYSLDDGRASLDAGRASFNGSSSALVALRRATLSNGRSRRRRSWRGALPTTEQLDRRRARPDAVAFDASGEARLPRFAVVRGEARRGMMAFHVKRLDGPATVNGARLRGGNARRLARPSTEPRHGPAVPRFAFPRGSVPSTFHVKRRPCRRLDRGRPSRVFGAARRLLKGRGA